MKFFSKKTIDFLKAAGEQSSTAWLAKNKHEHADLVIEPMKNLSKSLSLGFAREPLAKGYRLPRQGFGRLRRPARKIESGQPAYRNWIKLQATRPAKSIFDENPILYFFLSPTKIFSGAGFFDPSSRQVKKMRAWIHDDPDELVKLLKSAKFKREFPDGLSLDKQLKTFPRFYPQDHKRIEWLKLQGYYVNRTFTRKELFSKEFPDLLLENWKQGLKLNDLLFEIWHSEVEIPFAPTDEVADPDESAFEDESPELWDDRL